MANVTVETDTLKNGGKYVQTVYNNIEQSYTNIKSLSIKVPSFNSFQTALANKMAEFKNHSNVFVNKITECATELEKADNSIGSTLASQLESGPAAEGEGVVLTSNYSLSGNLDYTYDSSNTGISVEELYAKAEIIKNSNLPINIKVVKAAKLLHEYTLGWTWDRNNLSYSNFRSTLEIPTKTIVCATGVSDALYFAGAVNSVGNQVGTFNPNYQTNILITAQQNGWQRIDSSDFDQLQPGDIVFTGYDGSEYGHVELYAGNGYAYSWGSTNDMANKGPKSVSVAGYQSAGSCAYRITTSQKV